MPLDLWCANNYNSLALNGGGCVGSLPGSVVVTGAAELGHTHAPSETDETGGVVQCALAVQGCTLVAGTAFFSAFTNTGMTAPVFKLNF